MEYLVVAKGYWCGSSVVQRIIPAKQAISCYG